MLSERLTHAIDALQEVCARVFHFAGPALLRHRTEQFLSLLWNHGYMPVRRSEVESWRIALRAIRNQDDADVLIRQLNILLHDWRSYHAREPNSKRAYLYRRDIGKRQDKPR